MSEYDEKAIQSCKTTNAINRAWEVHPIYHTVEWLCVCVCV